MLADVVENVVVADDVVVFLDRNNLVLWPLVLLCIGAYGTVYKARDTANEGQMVALKKVRVPLTEEGVPMSTLREISLLKQMEKYEHPNIVR